MKSKLNYVVLTVGVMLAAPAALSWAGVTPVREAPELDPGVTVTALAMLGGSAAIIVERFRRRRK
jgi:hypothetical protein